MDYPVGFDAREHLLRVSTQVEAAAAVIAFSEAISREMLGQCVRVNVVEPRTVTMRLASHRREDIRQAARRQTEAIEPMQPEDIAGAVAHIVTRNSL